MSTSNDQLAPMRPTITASDNLETVQFDLKMSYDAFTNRLFDSDSEVFSPPGMSEPRFFLRMIPNSSIGNYVKLELHLVSSLNQKSIGVNFTTVILKQNEIVHTTTGNVSSTQGRSVCLSMPKRSSVLDSTSGLLVEDTLTYSCEFTFLISRNTDRILLADQVIEKLDSKRCITDDLDALFRDGSKYFDMVLVVGNKELHVYKGILAVRSPVFAAMFGNEENKEVQKGRVKIIDIDADVLEHMLRFIYTSKIPPLEKYAVELLVAAEKYQLDSLKSICEEYLCGKLGPDSMINLLLLADMHNATELKAAAIDYIANRASVQDALKALFENKIFGSTQSKKLIDAMRDLVVSKK